MSQKPAHQFPEEQVHRETVHYLSGVFTWTSFCLLIAAIIASWTTANPLFSSLLRGYSPAMSGLGSVLFFLITARWVLKSAWFAYPFCFLYWCLIGFSLALILRAYAGIPVTSLVLSASIGFALLAAHQHFLGRELSPNAADPFIIGVVAFALTILLYINIGGSRMDYVFIAAGAAGCIGITLSSLKIIKRQNTIGNEGTELDLRERVYGSLVLYLYFALFFMTIIRAANFAARANRRSNRRT
jgi:FtsH-binding integral membrane protein